MPKPGETASLAVEVLLEKGERAAPCIGSRLRSIGRAAVVEERVPGVGIGLDIVRHAILLQLHPELACHGRGKVHAGIAADDRAGAGYGVKRTRVRAVENGRGAHVAVDTGKLQSITTAHAKADRSNPRLVHLHLSTEIVERRLQVVNRAVLERTGEQAIEDTHQAE